ncbi:hypothetical protein [Corynebacterium guangdongense]|uniref:XRE family transcriptional regulator n=1 Tax=Corynebacterium guangdongense TaxID=1783348 RepID=A0ABU1ZVQ1_9CORY|nr:hypothetical protein [Corynebacterium guangdongense]MDR7329009.1 hypothetical protein [Corynebacterium guangdongense]WJZ17579.1 hypothetical protein CGUA_04970 [Corynebacterium guangdongense]
MTKDFLFRGDLARAGRAFASVSIQTIATDTGLSEDQIRHFERGGDNLSGEQRAALKRSLEKYGAHFIPESDGYGYGVRRRYPREKLMRLGTWEGEGGAWDHNS